MSQDSHQDALSVNPSKTWNKDLRDTQAIVSSFQPWSALIWTDPNWTTPNWTEGSIGLPQLAGVLSETLFIILH